MLNPYVNPRIIYNTSISLPLATYPVLLDNEECKNSSIVLVISQVQAIRSFGLLISGSIFDFIDLNSSIFTCGEASRSMDDIWLLSFFPSRFVKQSTIEAREALEHRLLGPLSSNMKSEVT